MSMSATRLRVTFIGLAYVHLAIAHHTVQKLQQLDRKNRVRINIQ
jgi:hypothetical protein